MSYELIVFPPDASGTLTPDNQPPIPQHPATHSTGRPGIGFTVPDSTPQSQGCQIHLVKAGKVPINQRAILFVNNGDSVAQGYPWGPGQTAAIAVDDFQFEDAASTPTPPVPEPPSNASPKEIIDWVYATGDYNLATKTGCGLFTEACCTALHNYHSPAWGHIKKNPGQNQFNGHAVDAVMLLINVNETDMGGYDIVTESESQNAKPAFNYAGPPDGALWYYPAAGISVSQAETAIKKSLY